MFFGVAFFEVIVNVASFIIYRRSCKTTRFSRIERNLFVVTLGMFGATILMALFLVSFTFFFSTSLHGYKKREWRAYFNDLFLRKIAPIVGTLISFDRSFTFPKEIFGVFFLFMYRISMLHILPIASFLLVPSFPCAMSDRDETPSKCTSEIHCTIFRYYFVSPVRRPFFA